MRLTPPGSRAARPEDLPKMLARNPELARAIVNDYINAAQPADVVEVKAVASDSAARPQESES